MNEHPEFDLLDAFALGTLGETEAAALRAHLSSCTGCRAELAELQAVLDVLPHGLPQVRASARVRDGIFAQLDASKPARRPRPPVALAALAAALALAVGLDVWLAAALRNAQRLRPTSPAIALATPAAHPALVRPTPAHPASARTPAPAGVAPTPSAAPDPALRLRIAELTASLAVARFREQREGARDRERIESLERRLAEARASVVALAHSAPVRTPEPAPEPVRSAPAPSPELVAALSTGRVYGVDGVVGSEPWHLTIVQPLAGKDAIIYTRTPDAPAGDTYRTWVLRGGTTFDAGELPPSAQTELDMPMPLQSGDEVAFSREPVGTGDRPTSPFLMKVTIGP